jgi:hypothetical protein
MGIFHRLRQLCCRHEDILRMEKDRMWLECMACGRATIGFDGLGCATRVSDLERTPAHAADWYSSALKNRAA